MDNVCYAEFTYGSCIRRCGAVVDMGMYTTLAGFNVGSVSGGRWQQRRCICTGRLVIGEAGDLDTRRTPFLLFAALHRAAVEGREGSRLTAGKVVQSLNLR